MSFAVLGRCATAGSEVKPRSATDNTEPVTTDSKIQHRVGPCPGRFKHRSKRQVSRPTFEINGELVVGTGERLDFGALQQRMVNSAATIRRRLAPKEPASYVAFDLLAIDQVDTGARSIL
jgi:hypothetical protein